MLTGKEAWDFVKKCGGRNLPHGYSIYYRSTKYSEWIPAKFNWCILRDYFYKNGKDTGWRSYELCINIKYPHSKHSITHFMHELNEFDFDDLGIQFVNAGDGI